MKKFISGVIVGVLIMVSGTTLAETTTVKNLVGKVIQGQFPVSVDGVQLENPAIVVDGTSFLPVRQFGETVGYAVYFDPEGKIRLEAKEVTPAKLSAEEQKNLDEKNLEVRRATEKGYEDNVTRAKKYKSQLDEANAKSLKLQKILEQGYEDYLKIGGDPDKWENSDGYKILTNQIAEQQAIIDEAQAQLDALK